MVKLSYPVIALQPNLTKKEAVGFVLSPINHSFRSKRILVLFVLFQIFTKSSGAGSSLSKWQKTIGGRQSAFSLLNTIEHRLITEPAISHYLVFGLIKGFFFYFNKT